MEHPIFEKAKKHSRLKGKCFSCSWNLIASNKCGIFNSCPCSYKNDENMKRYVKACNEVLGRKVLK